MQDYILRHSQRAKHIRLAVYHDGRVVLTVPSWIGGEMVAKFFQEKSEWVRAKLEQFKKEHSVIPHTRTRKEYLARKDEALALVRARLEYFNARYGFPIGRVSIRNQKTRWGSCSSRGTISINYRIVFLSPAEQDYIIVHELCHVREMNHSPRFWALVAKALPEYQTIKHSLRNQRIV